MNNNSNRGKAFILSAPAGTGKSTLVDKLTKEFTHVVRSISFTTRKPRGAEKDGHDYHFVSYQQFEQKINRQDFIEYAKVFDQFYGTDKAAVEKLLEQGFDVVLVIDTQGALTIKPFFDGVYIFMGPPSIEELKKRLCSRNTDQADEIALRLSWAEKEMQQAKHYDYSIVNHNLEETYQIFKSIFIAEKHKTHHF